MKKKIPDRLDVFCFPIKAENYYLWGKQKCYNPCLL